jgi:hypothetical protein
MDGGTWIRLHVIFFIISHFLKLNQHINVGGRARDYAMFAWLINHG